MDEATQDARNIEREVARRRTFAIISHPDAGKTTLTEKLLLYGGAIHLAGTIKAKKASRHATSDWMEIEKERGISITSSVLQFDYDAKRINLLDTPGHQDFSEDTYRTLSAADSAVMLIDNAKGVETQTKKLFEVCRLRGLPIFTFINKLDREGRDPLDVMSEIEQLLGIQCVPVMWPIGMGRRFRGVYNRHTQQVHLFQAEAHGSKILDTEVIDAADPRLPEVIGDDAYKALREELDLLDAAGTEFSKEKVLSAAITPVYFGSALTNFGVEPFLQSFLQTAPPPGAYNSAEGKITPGADQFSGFIFKIQANMDPAHRDRVAFLRICSGRFERGMPVKHVRLGKEIRLTKPMQFMAQERTIIDEAYGGDIIGLFDTGILRIGDTLCDGKPIKYDEVPHFSPEHFARIRIKDPLKRKQLKKGLDELSEEGAVQVFYQMGRGDMDPIVGAVGQLQFEVMQYRLENEYGAPIIVDKLAFDIARWVSAADGDLTTVFDQKAFTSRDRTACVEDKDGHPMVLFKGEWSLRHAQNDFPKLKFMMTAHT